MIYRIVAFGLVALAGCTFKSNAICVSTVSSTTLHEISCGLDAPQGICFSSDDVGFWPPPWRVGDSLEIPYQLLGAVPAGDYLLSLRGQSSSDAKAHAELVHRPREGNERSIASADGVSGQGVTGGLPGDMNLVLSGSAIPSSCGDKLVLKLMFLSGSSPYLELIVSLKTP